MLRQTSSFFRKSSSMFLAFVMVAGMLPSLASADGNFTAEDLTLQPGSDTSQINLNWYADDGTMDAKVRFTAGATILTADAAESTAITGKVACKATVTGLSANTAYTYQVSNDGGLTWSEVYTYQTAGTGEFSFAFVGDPQLNHGAEDAKSNAFSSDSTTAQGWADTLSAIASAGVDFIASAGDQINDSSGGSEDEYADFFAPDEMQSFPFAAAIGNHDRNSGCLYHYNLPNEQDVSDIVNLASTAAATEVTTAAGNYYYSYNNALYVVLNDSSYPTSVAAAQPYIEAFRQTLEAAINAFPSYTWLFVQHHKSTQSVAQHVADYDIQYYVEAGFENLMDEYKVDFVLAGHDHVYARSFAMYNGQRVSDSTDSMTNSAGTIYITCNTGSGLKYYDLFSTGLYVNDNTAYPYLANGLIGSAEYMKGVLPLSTYVQDQSKIPGYTIISVNNDTVTFNTYDTYATEDSDHTSNGTAIDTFTVTKDSSFESKTQGVSNSKAALTVEQNARYNSEVVNADGGSSEIVEYNSDNDCAYAVNGTTGHFVKIDMSGLSNKTTVRNMTGVTIPVKEIMQTYCPEFSYGDMTSIAVSTQANVIAVALQSSDYTANGKIALLTYNGTYITSYDTGAQPDMITFTADGMTVLTANEGEPRNGAGETDPKGSVTIVELDILNLPVSSVSTVDFTDFDALRDTLVATGVVLLKGALPSTDLEPEYITVTGTTAYISLQEASAIAVLDLDTKTFTGIYPLGLQDFSISGVDLQKDDTINITTYENVYGIKMPDGISSYSAKGKTYLLTANEGDSRSDWDGMDNEYEEKTSPTGNVTMTKDVVWFNANLYDGLDTSKAYVFGSRSFSIYEVSEAGLTLVYDSGSDFETITAAELPANFNCSNDKISMDNRSGKKGPEPETVITGVVGNMIYAFVALERIGGIVVYNITDPANATYENYINSRDFSSAIAGDVSPEGLCFIPASQSVTGSDLLLSANEVSGTVAAYKLTAKSTTTHNSSQSTTKSYAITAVAGANGSISPNGSFIVTEGSSKVFTILPNSGYEVADVLVNGKSVGAVASYTFGNVTQAQTISVAFKEKTVEVTNPYTDIFETDWFYDDVLSVYDKGLIQGTTATTFSPYATSSRAMMVTILYRMEGKPAVTGKSAFTDVESGQYYTDAVIWATQNAIVLGYENGRFGVDDNITREQLVAFMYRYAQFKNYNTSQGGMAIREFADYGSISDYAVSSLQWAVNAGFVKGKTDTTVAPKDTATHAELATLINRFSENITK